MSHAHIFRRYDIRGVVDVDLTEAIAESIGRAIGTRVVEAGGELTYAVGRDCRVHSPKLRNALVAGLISTGVHVKDCGVVPTPLLYFAVHELGLGGGVMITGSHNPPEFNGFKMMLGEDTIHGDAIQGLRQLIDDGAFVVAAVPGTVVDVDILTPYTDFVVDNITLGDWPPNRPLKIVVDAGNGVGSIATLPVLKGLGVEVVSLYETPDGTFPNHHPDPTEAKNLVDLIAAVAEHSADFGVAYDGDGDRIGVVDDQGTIIWGDKLMILFSRALLQVEPGATIVGEVKCSQTLFDDIRAHGGNAIMWKVGHSLIKAKMKEEGALLAGEMSGHIFFKHRFFGFDDATYATVRLAELVSQGSGPVSGLLTGVPETFATPELRVDTPESRKFAIADQLASIFARDYEVVAIDGVRVIFEDGWGLVRASNTQPALVIRAEAQTPERRDAILALLREQIAAADARLSD